MCWVCRRPQKICWCAAVQPFHSDPEIIIVVHPREAKNPMGTLRIVRRHLSNCRVFVGNGPEIDAGFASVLQQGGRTVLLYPDAEAVPISEANQTGLPIDRVVVIDATWATAKQLLRTSVLLSSFPKVSLSPSGESIYRVRKQPAPHCLSTVEAVHDVLEAVRGSRVEHGALLKSFRSAIDMHLAEMAKSPQVRRIARPVVLS